MIREIDLEKTTDVSKPVYKKITANQYAKKELYSALESAFYFHENDDSLTDKEAQLIREQMEKRMRGIRKYLSI